MWFRQDSIRGNYFRSFLYRLGRSFRRWHNHPWSLRGEIGCLGQRRALRECMLPPCWLQGESRRGKEWLNASWEWQRGSTAAIKNCERFIIFCRKWYSWGESDGRKKIPRKDLCLKGWARWLSNVQKVPYIAMRSCWVPWLISFRNIIRAVAGDLSRIILHIVPFLRHYYGWVCPQISTRSQTRYQGN